MSTKICNKCGELKSFDCYYKSKSNKYGLTTSCKTCTKIRIKESISRNKDNVAKYQKEYATKNKEKLKEYIHQYRKENKDKISKVQQNKRNSNPILKLNHNISNLIRQCLRRKGYTKRSKSFNIIGCSYQQLLEHLNNNIYGFVYEDGLYDIDHKIPVSSAKTEEELLELNHYSNLQLLPRLYNQGIKKNKPWNKQHFEEWLENSPM